MAPPNDSSDDDFDESYLYEDGDESPAPPESPVLVHIEDLNLTKCEGACSKRYHDDEIVRCQANHPFCLEDAANYSKTQFGKGVLVLNCINSNCNKIFPGAEVLRFLDLSVFAGFPKERLEAMIKAVGVVGLVEICPYCITVNNTGPLTSQAKIVVCSKCQRQSCRKCKKTAHEPVECEAAAKTSLECQHCLKTYPPAEIVRCEVGHPSCLQAVKDYTATQLGKGTPVLQCLEPSCDKIYPGVEVLRFIDLKVFAGLPKERLEIMIDKVGVRGLVEICPNCITVVACGPLEKTDVLKCTNSSCGKSYCRKCQKEIKGPHTCEDEDNLPPDLRLRYTLIHGLEELIIFHIDQGEVVLAIESMLDDAFFQKCNFCRTKNLKQNGNNTLTCSACGKLQCYICAESITGAEHFGKPHGTRGVCQAFD